jgi:xylulokinase
MIHENNFYMGIDIGTFETKGVIINYNGEIIASHIVKHDIEKPQEGYYEHDAEFVWWNDFCQVSKSLLLKASLKNSQIKCICSSTLGSDCLPVDKNCNPLRKAILYGIDCRSQKEIEYLTNYYGNEKVQELFGRPICSGDIATKILWLRNNEPDIHEKAYKFITGSTYIVAKLTGKYVIDRFLSRASFRPLYKEDGSVDVEYSSLYCRPDQLAKTAKVTDIAGYVSGDAAKQTGLAKGTPVLTGTGDSTAEAISAGVLKSGDLMLQLGSTLFMYCCTDHLIEDDRVRGNIFTIPGTYSIAAGTNTAGTLTRWFRDNLFADIFSKEKESGKNAFESMIEGIDCIPPGSNGLIMLPYMAGERTPINDPKAKGLIFGLKLEHTRKHLYRSALESVAYSIDQHIDIFKECGVNIKKIVAVGGGAKNHVWMQIIADVINMPLLITEISIGASYGDALMAALGGGRFKNFSELEDIIKVKKRILPNQKNYAKYKFYRKIYDELYKKNKALMHKIK